MPLSISVHHQEFPLAPSRMSNEEGQDPHRRGSRQVSTGVKVVFDSNIFVSAFTLPGGSGERPLLNVIDGRDSLALSKPILDELLSVLARRFSRDREGLARVAIFLADIAEFVVPNRKLETLSDEPDDRVLECAVATDADYIVTGDHAMLELGELEGVQIISLREYLDR